MVESMPYVSSAEWQTGSGWAKDALRKSVEVLVVVSSSRWQLPWPEQGVDE